MKNRLLRIYMTVLVPAAILAVGSYIAVLLGAVVPIAARHPGLYRTLSASVVIASMALGLALPLLYRGFFVNRVKDTKAVSAEDFFRFQRNLLFIALSAPFMVTAAAITGLVQYHLYAVILVGLYAAYYYYPSDRRLGLDMRIFRVKENDTL